MDSNARNRVLLETDAAVGKAPVERSCAFYLNQWLVLPESNELKCRSSGERRSLEPRLMRLLCLLAAAPQRVFGRDELMAHLWPRVIVNENSLTRAISDLRRKLSHSSDANQLIDTIPKRGYRLALDCEVTDRPESDHRDAVPVAPALVTIPGHQRRIGVNVLERFRLPVPRLAAAASLMVGAVLVVLLQIQQPLVNSPGNAGIALADINLSNSDSGNLNGNLNDSLTNQEAFDALLASRMETVAAHAGIGDAQGIQDLERLGATQPVMSRDGGLFAYIRYHEEGSSLLLGSTQLPSSPVTIFTTEDTIYNLQWSPIARALLFAQSPRMTPAALLPGSEQASLVLFDLDTFTTRVLEGPATEAETNPEHAQQRRSFKLTALGRSLGWLS